MKCPRLSLLALSLGTLLSSTTAQAAAFQLYELGTPVVGTAGVGQAAIASDASTAYFNPAGMAFLSNTQLMLGSEVILPYANFSPNSSNTIAGNNGGSAGVLTPAVGGFFVYNLSSKFKLGISLTAPYGGSLNYNDHWVGRYVVQQMTLYTLNLNPAIAYQINDWLAIGGGLSIEYANLYQTVAIPLSSTVDGQATVKVDSAAPGGNLGLLIKPTPSTKVGIAYRSQIVHNLSGDIGFMNTSATPSATTKLVMPANIIASISQAITNQFTLLGEVGWANWSSMVNTIIHVDGFSVVTQQNWHDTYRLGLGGQYQFTPDFLLQAGGSFDSSPTSSSKRLPDLPMDRQIRLGMGIEYALIQAATLGLSYEYVNFGNASINNSASVGTLSGNYSRNFANFFQASLNVRC